MEGKLEIFFATSNAGKAEEADAVLGKAGISVRRFPFDYREIRSDSLEEIARDAVAEARRRCGKQVFVEDSGLFIEPLGGFPGTYSGWVHKKIGNAGILRLMEGMENRSARFEACIAFHDGRDVSVFKGLCRGSISMEARGSGGFGYDPVFIPEGKLQTFAENKELKNNLSHRYKALLELSKSLASVR